MRELPDAYDVIVLDRVALSPEQLAALRNAEVFVPAVVIGDVRGSVDYHEAEVHLPPNQLEQLSYSVDASIAWSLRRGLRMGGAENDAAHAQTSSSQGGMLPAWQLVQ